MRHDPNTLTNKEQSILLAIMQLENSIGLVEGRAVYFGTSSISEMLQSDVNWYVKEKIDNLVVLGWLEKVDTPQGHFYRMSEVGRMTVRNRAFTHKNTMIVLENDEKTEVMR